MFLIFVHIELHFTSKGFLVKPHTSDIRMTYVYIQVPYGCHTSTYEWHTDDIRVHANGIRVTYEYIRVTSNIRMTFECIRITRAHMSDIRMKYEYIRVTYEWHARAWHTSTSKWRLTYEWHTSGMRVQANDIRITYEWHASGIRSIKQQKRFEALRSQFSTLFMVKHCFRRLRVISCY